MSAAASRMHTYIANRAGGQIVENLCSKHKEFSLDESLMILRPNSSAARLWNRWRAHAKASTAKQLVYAIKCEVYDAEVSEIMYEMQAHLLGRGCRCRYTLPLCCDLWKRRYFGSLNIQKLNPTPRWEQQSSCGVQGWLQSAASTELQ